MGCYSITNQVRKPLARTEIYNLHAEGVDVLLVSGRHPHGRAIDRIMAKAGTMEEIYRFLMIPQSTEDKNRVNKTKYCSHTIATFQYYQ